MVLDPWKELVPDFKLVFKSIEKSFDYMSGSDVSDYLDNYIF